MRELDRIICSPNQMNGQPCIRGVRLTVRRVVEAVSIYSDRNELFRNYPELDAEDVRQALAFAAANFEDVEQAWKQEIALRAREVESGVVETVSWDEVRRHLRHRTRP